MLKITICAKNQLQIIIIQDILYHFQNVIVCPYHIVTCSWFIPKYLLTDCVQVAIHQNKNIQKDARALLWISRGILAIRSLLCISIVSRLNFRFISSAA